jgi:UDP-N-acetylglucosamine 2-epimerase (non-hydrolysing)
MNLPNEWFNDVKYILVQGDTTSVVGLSLSALHRKIKIIHLEAGLRTYDNKNPFPEENNRRIVSSIADIHLCPTINNKNNLIKENIPEDKIFVVGNTGLDNLVEYKNKISYENTVLITIHRRENHESIESWFTEINKIASKYKNIEFILPIHPNPNVKKFKKILKNIKVIEPLSHEDLLSYLVRCKLVITDSGGLQEECSFLNKKCLVCRTVTERPESIGLSSFIVDDYSKLELMFNEHINDYFIKNDCPYGEGNSSKKIISIFKNIL